jgi:hypothetical protein
MSRVEKIRAHLQKRKDKAKAVAEKAAEAEKLRLLDLYEKDRLLP